MNINSSILTYTGETHTGKHFGGVVIACCTGRDKLYRFLFNANGEPVNDPEQAKEVGNWLERDFKKGKLDNETIYLNIE